MADIYKRYKNKKKLPSLLFSFKVGLLANCELEYSLKIGIGESLFHNFLCDFWGIASWLFVNFDPIFAITLSASNDGLLFKFLLSVLLPVVAKWAAIIEDWRRFLNESICDPF